MPVVERAQPLRAALLKALKAGHLHRRARRDRSRGPGYVLRGFAASRSGWDVRTRHPQARTRPMLGHSWSVLWKVSMTPGGVRDPAARLRRELGVQSTLVPRTRSQRGMGPGMALRSITLSQRVRTVASSPPMRCARPEPDAAYRVGWHTAAVCGRRDQGQL